MSPLDRLRWAAGASSLPMSPTTYRLATHLALAASDGTGVAWASRRTLAVAIGCDEARLVRAFRELESAGLLRRGELSGPCGRQTYRWHLLPPASGAPGAPNAPGADPAGPPPASGAINPLRPTPHKGGSEGGSYIGSNARNELQSHPGHTFTTKDGKPWSLTTDDHRKLIAAHPDLDVDDELAKAVLWCDANPAKRKTSKGMLRFLAGWMSRANPSEPAPAPMRRLDVPDQDDDVVDLGLVPALGRMP